MTKQFNKGSMHHGPVSACSRIRTCVGVVAVTIGLLAVACGQPGSPTEAPVGPTATARSSEASRSAEPEAQPEPSGPNWNAPTLESAVLRPGDHSYIRFRSDGQRLWAIRRTLEDIVVALVRLDPVTGEELAELPLPAEIEHGRPNYRIVTDGLWVETATAELSLVDPDTLEVQETVSIPPGVHAIQNFQVADELWVSYRQSSEERRSGAEQFEGAIRFDTDGSELESYEFLQCGVRDTLRVVRDLWFSISCRNQLIIVDGATGEQSVVAPYPSNARLFLDDELVWAAFGATGVVATLDPGTAEVLSGYDVNADNGSPDIRTILIVGTTPSSVLALGLPVDDAAPSVLARFDRRTGLLLGRALLDQHSTSVAFQGETGFTSRIDGGVATFDVTAIDQVSTRASDSAAFVAEPTVLTTAVPATDDEAAVLDAFGAVLDRNTTAEAAGMFLEDSEALSETWEELLLAATTTFDGVEIVVASIFVENGRAEITYSFLFDGEPAFLPRPGFLTQDPTTLQWQLSRQTFCDLAAAAFVPCP